MTAIHYSIEMARQLRSRLFQPRVFRDHIARYDRIDDATEQVAAKTWAVHGVCLSCRCLTVMVGRCAECGIDYSQGLHYGERQALGREQLATADAFLRTS